METTEIKDLIALASGMIMILLWLASLILACMGFIIHFTVKNLAGNIKSTEYLLKQQRRSTIYWITAYVLLGAGIGFLFICLFFQSSG